MATIRKLESGKWQVIVRRQGHPPAYKTFTTRNEGERWARGVEMDMDKGAFVPASNISIGSLIDDYIRLITPHKKSARNDRQRLLYLKQHFGKMSVSALRSTHIAEWRDKRLAEGRAGATVVKEINSLSHLLEVAQKDWNIGLSSNVARMVRKPKQARGRDRRLREGELEAIIKASCSKSLPSIVLLAVETAMRMGEIASLRWERINLEKRVAKLLDTKNGESRLVPLSAKAIEVLATLKKKDEGEVFSITPNALSRAFNRAVARAREKYRGEDARFLTDLHFHDLRHEAVSSLFERGLNPMEVASVSGHKTMQMLKRYTHLKAEDLALRL